MVARCIFHIDLDAFFVSAEQAAVPELKEKIVIVGGSPGHRGVVASASYEARSFGIHAGMPSSQARHLCPRAVFLQPNFPRYKEASAKFMKILASFSPEIEPLGLDEAYLNATGCEGLHGTPRDLALLIKGRIRQELDISASVGIAKCKVIAKVASDLCKPDGLLEIAPGEERDFLRPLPIKKLPGIGSKTEETLHTLGISTIGELALLPLEIVKSRFGLLGVTLLQHANGIDERRVTAQGEPKSFSLEVTFPRDTSDRHLIETTLHHLCQRVGENLRRQNKSARCIAIKLRYSNFETITRQITLKESGNATQFIFRTAAELLNKALPQRGNPFRLIGVSASLLTGQGKQLPLLDPEMERLTRLDQAIDQIRQKYGAPAIQQGIDDD
ncbi:MAG: DNA polymerase IV [Dehalococcoidia bacterium]|nr:DNA polymerase IV [Dehalococcoidia bacterium]